MSPSSDDAHVAFSDLATAAYCPRKLYYRRRRDDYQVPKAVRERRALAFRYPDLLAPGADLAAEPIAVTPTQFRARLNSARARIGTDAWASLVEPDGREVTLTGKDCRGVAHKVLAAPLAPSLVFAGEPPDVGVWHPQSVRAVAAAKALAWEREAPVERAFVEYPAHGVVRELELTARRRAAYRRTLRTVRALDGPPPRLGEDAKCEPCEYRPTCGTQTRSLRSRLLGDG